MHIISMRRLREFWEVHPKAAAPLRAWFTHVEQAHWGNFVEVRRDFPNADLVGRLTVFNISGNKFRLIVRIEYEKQRVYIRAVLTHTEYDSARWKNDDWYTE